MAECPKGFDKTEEKTEDIWTRLTKWYSIFSSPGAKWIFRGQRNCRWDLQPTLERYIIEFSTEEKADSSGCRDSQIDARIAQYSRILGKGLELKFKLVDQKWINVYSIEHGILREFQRRCYHYLSDLPAEDSTLEWLALMRHYGGPTRLLDWTYSFFVAVFNAVEQSEGACAVYALDADAIDDSLKQRFSLRWSHFHTNPYMDNGAFVWLLGPKSLPSVYAVNPFRLNQRLTAQQGLFLVPARLDISFEENLAAHFGHQALFTDCIATPPTPDTCTSEADAGKSRKQQEEQPKWYKIAICTTVRQRNQILRHLQDMNISKATLYTDLQGFAESLRTRLAFPDILVSDDFSNP